MKAVNHLEFYKQTVLFRVFFVVVVVVFFCFVFLTLKKTNKTLRTFESSCDDSVP